MKEKPKRAFPEVYERWIPVLLAIFAIAIVGVMFFAVAVALGLV